MTYRLSEAVPSPDEYVALREEAGMGRRTETAAERGLGNGVHAVTVREAATGELVAMGRLVGDDGCFYQLVDIAVAPDHQGRGLGTRVVTALLDHLRENAPESAYVSLVADVDGFYERFGFEDVAPDSKGMSLTVDDL
ncbi:GNAT family N-acetyltransferase [Halorussus sp. MSC15.2]|uniref:GNAT family N-acetyltransferase n=1 Tax=Halorussus sp. MSC15.2 TaxID=2283638 RepID=UPI0013D3AFCA|nr:GNAT family N-acetyltransferase [Halorussus sp. MSC15.2]NEU57931.1 GNAT family N-acetyltransferase [Halorussus sp. MSC15.2]